MKKERKRFNPYYKARNIEDNKELMSFRIPNDLKKDLEKYFKESNQSRTDGMNKLIYDFLNTHCFERKSFAYGIYIMALKPFDFNLDDLICLGIQDGYATMDSEQFNADAILNEDAESFTHFTSNKYEYLEYDSVMPNTLKHNVFIDNNLLYDSFIINYQLFENPKSFRENIDPKSFVEYVEKAFDVDMDETYFINLTLNNYLDIKADGMFKAKAFENDSRHHKGLNVIVDGHGKEYYVIYDWILISDMNFYHRVQITDFQFISREQFYEVIENSTNQKLKNYIKSFDDFADVQEIEIQDRIDSIESKIRDLERQKKDLESMLD